MNFPSRCILTLAYAWSAVALGASTSGGDISRVIGSVRVEAGHAARDVSTARSGSRSGPSSSRPRRSTAT